MKGYTPSDHDLPRLIMEGEILKRHEPKRNDEEHNKPRHEKKTNRKFKNDNKFRGKQDANKELLFCKECGKNPSHATVDCWKLKNRLKREADNKKAGEQQPFSKRSFRKEVNALAQTAKKHGCMDVYAQEVERAHGSRKRPLQKGRPRPNQKAIPKNQLTP